MTSKRSGLVKGTATAPLLYWLAVICGLTGLTVIRIDDATKVVPIWFGAIVGLSIGQLIAVLRIRIWTAALVALMSSWIVGPAVYIALCELFRFGADTDTALMALLPAVICGYASLTERGGLLAFWYPAMLWMLVILDGEAPGSFAPRAYLPMAIGLGVFFVAFLRARETRRATLWRAYSHVRLATPGESAVLSGSPVRGMGQLGWTAMVGAGAFLLAAWVAPNLFQKDRAIHKKMTQVPPPARWDTSAGMPCCPESWETEKVKEYMPLKNERESSRTRLACTYCPAPQPTEEWGPYGHYRGAGIRTMNPHVRYAYDDGYYAPSELTFAYNPDGTTTHSWNGGNGYGYATNYGTPGNDANAYAWNGTHANWGTNVQPAYTPPHVDPAPTYVPPTYVAPTYVPPTPEPVKPAPIVKHDPKPAKPAKPAAIVTTPTPAPVVVQEAPKPVATPEPPKPPAPPTHEVTPPAHPTEAPEPSAPWGILLPLLAGVLLIPMGTRFVRRQVTLRHLARPFWKEPADQRISNHWQRMLIGLRDAGIQLRSSEQPAAFAKRIAIKGMDEAATILERVRHGVRIEDEDLATMGKATDEIYGEARKKAGPAGRIAASFRWPLV